MPKFIDLAGTVTKSAASDLKAAGVEVIGRYIGSQSSWKTIKNAERDAIIGAGLKIVSIYETNPTKRAYFTAEQGKSDALAAAAAAVALGQAKETPIYFTVDYGAPEGDYDAIAAYLKAVAANLSAYKVGIYGHYGIIKLAHDKKLAERFFQTYAWSAGKVYPNTDLYQNKNGQHLAGLTVDFGELGSELSAWPVDAPKPVKKVVAKKAASKKSGSVVPYPGHLIQSGDKGKDVIRIQNAVGAKADGIFGPKTEAGVKAYQKRHGLASDGIVGPKTWSVMF